MTARTTRDDQRTAPETPATTQARPQQPFEPPPPQPGGTQIFTESEPIRRGEDRDGEDRP